VRATSTDARVDSLCESVQGLAVNKVFKLHRIVYIMSCDVRVRSGSRLRSTHAQSQLGREGKTPSCRRIILYYGPSSPFSLSMRRRCVLESTNDEARRPIASVKSDNRASGPHRI